MLKKNDLLKIEKQAVKVAEEAGKVLLRYYRKNRLQVREKAKASLVTQADVNSEKLIQRRLQKLYPDFIFLGEEGGQGVGDAETTPMWHVDPLDGTTNFVHGFPMFCVSIGLAVGNQPVVGVIHIPTLGETFHGSRGNGARLNGKPMRVSKRTDLSECLLTTGFAYIQDETKLFPEIERFKRVHLEARAVRRPGAAAIDLAYVAAGRFDGFWEMGLSPWDMAAGALLIQE
ncbi:MAG: inositol monophosphatase, partial [Bdellovibrionales bacterium]|nr:inositol monophosphatase [Bdellovibrionales bacterium]